METKRAHCPDCDRTVRAERRPVNHVLHLLATVFLCGLWLPVWILVALGLGREPYRCPECGYAMGSRLPGLIAAAVAAIVFVGLLSIGFATILSAAPR